MGKSPRIYVESANTPHTRSLGLMYRDRLGKKAGMLFSFDRLQKLSFWMKDTPTPLDIAFITDDFEIFQISSLVPYSTKSVSASRACRYALEVNSGWFGENGIGIGSKIVTSQFSKIDDDEDEGDDDTEKVQEVEEPPPTPVEPEEIPLEPAQEPTPRVDLMVNMALKDAVSMANEMKLAIAFDYEYPEGNINSYVMYPLSKYEVKPGRTKGDLVGGPCVHSGGEYRNFIIDNVTDFDLYETEGENAGRLVLVPGPDPISPIPSTPGELVASNYPVVMIKEAQGYSTGQLMMGEYWDSLKKKRDEGKTEGQAILEYLDENTKRNAPQKKKKSKKKKK